VRSLGILTPEPLECPALYPGQVNVLLHQQLLYSYLVPKRDSFSFLFIVKKFVLSKHNRHSFFSFFSVPKLLNNRSIHQNDVL
jgi:hypothetical protein